MQPSVIENRHNFIRGLRWKNWLIKKRHPVATLLELCVSMLFILLLRELKHTTTDARRLEHFGRHAPGQQVARHGLQPV